MVARQLGQLALDTKVIPELFVQRLQLPRNVSTQEPQKVWPQFSATASLIHHDIWRIYRRRIVQERRSLLRAPYISSLNGCVICV